MTAQLRSPLALPPERPTYAPPPSPMSAQPQSVFWLGDTLWSLYGDIRDRLFDQHGLLLEHWKSQGQATLVKSGAGRTIYRVRLPGMELYVKHFRATNWTNRLHQLIRQGRAEKEFQLAHLLQENGVATIQPVALGEKRKHGLLLESYLLTMAIPQGLTLFELIERCVLTGRLEFPPRLRFHFAEELARVAASIHECGAEHRDLHEKNIVVQPAEDGRYRFFLLDLHELKMHRQLSWGQIARELARMGRYFTLRTTKSDRLRFFRHYARLRGFAADEWKRLARVAEWETMESRADFWRRRDTRPLRKATRIQAIRGHGARAFAVQEIPQETVLELMRDPDAAFRDAVVHWWKIGRATRVAEVELPAIRKGETLIYKQYYFKGWHESLATLFRLNQAGRAWNSGASLLLRELPTPRPLILLEKIRFGLPVTSYLITERVRGAQTLNRYIHKRMMGATPEQARATLLATIRQAARLMRELHDRRVTHRDLKASNILVSDADRTAEPKLWLIDLDGVQTWQTVPESHRLQNLTRFYVSFHHAPWLKMTDRLRFLREYLGRSFDKPGYWKSLWRQILHGTEQKIRRNLRKGRSVV